LLDSEYGEDVVHADGSLLVGKGQDLAYAPKLSGHFGLDHVLSLGDAGVIRSNANYACKSSRTHSGASTDPIYAEDNTGLLSARVTWTSFNNSRELSAWRTDLTDEDTIEGFGGVTDDFGFVSVSRGAPRIYGIDVSLYY
jgi:hypothetical protein